MALPFGRADVELVWQPPPKPKLNGSWLVRYTNQRDGDISPVGGAWSMCLADQAEQTARHIAKAEQRSLHLYDEAGVRIGTESFT